MSTFMVQPQTMVCGSSTKGVRDLQFNPYERPGTGMAYVDSNGNSTAVPSSSVNVPLLDSLLAAGSLFPSNLQTHRLVSSSGSAQYLHNLQLAYLDLAYSVSQSQANNLIAADLFNRVRVCVWWTEDPYRETVLPTWSVDDQPDWREVKKVLYDEIHVLVSQAFDSTNFNAPGVAARKLRIDLGQYLETLSTGSSGSNWDTRRGNLVLTVTSDSGLAPHPVITYRARLYYKDLE